MQLLLILGFLLQPCLVYGDSCVTQNVSGVEGGDIILCVNQTGIRFINWILLSEGSVIVTTKPGESIDDKVVRKQFRGRVRSEDDGSLHIYKLSLQDQRIYKADIWTTGDPEEICMQYNITVYEKLSSKDIQINHTVTSNDSCSLGLLCSVNKRNVNITWSKLPSSDINVTRGVLYVPPSGVNNTYICTAYNPVSNVSKSVIPWEYCKPKTESPPVTNTRLSYLGILGILPTLAVIPALYIAKKKKKSPENDAPTIHAQVEDQKTQVLNLYQQSEGKKEEPNTLYTEVQQVKKETPQKKMNGQEGNPVETVYSTVTEPQKKNPQKKENGQKEKPIESLYSTVTSPQGRKENGSNGQSAGASNYNLTVYDKAA